MWDIVEFCKRNGILVQGRGSAANSAVCYALEITAIDPVGMELLFERFLSESRENGRTSILIYPPETNASKRFSTSIAAMANSARAMTANVITYRGKSPAREIGKALGFDAETLGVSQAWWLNGSGAERMTRWRIPFNTPASTSSIPRIA